MKAIVSVSLVAALLAAGAAAACQFDLDCSSGGKCLKDFGASYGVCYGGARPGSDGDRRPGPVRGDPNHTAGNTCSVDAECGAGNQCLKAVSGQLGVCVKD
jgi:hypothetical protein